MDAGAGPPDIQQLALVDRCFFLQLAQTLNLHLCIYCMHILQLALCSGSSGGGGGGHKMHKALHEIANKLAPYKHHALIFH